MKIEIMQGIPGSGKSVLADKLYQEALARNEDPNIVSADHFFLDENGVYKWDGSKIGDAHKQCMLDFINYLELGVSPVIVDNTNINLEDIAPYVAVGEALGYEVEIHQFDCDPVLGASRNLHGVPKERVEQMFKRLNKSVLPRRWKVTTHTSQE